MLEHFDASNDNLLANASTRRYKNAMHTSMTTCICCQNLTEGGYFYFCAWQLRRNICLLDLLASQ